MAQIAIETASVESAEVDLDDSGLVIVRLNTLEQPAAPEPEHGPTLSVHLQLFSEIDAARGRWKLSGRGVTLELTKSRVGRWNALVAGAAPASIKVAFCPPPTLCRLVTVGPFLAPMKLPSRMRPDTRGGMLLAFQVDWSQYLDYEEEAELKSNPHVNKADMMRGAMGTDWGSNLDSHLAAQEQVCAFTVYYLTYFRCKMAPAPELMFNCCAQAQRLDTSAHGDAAADDEISMYT